MNARRFAFALVALLALASSIAFSGIARSAHSRGVAGRSYVQKNLVSDIPGLAARTDPNLKNPGARRSARAARSGSRTTTPE